MTDQSACLLFGLREIVRDEKVLCSLMLQLWYVKSRSTATVEMPRDIDIHISHVDMAHALSSQQHKIRTARPCRLRTTYALLANGRVYVCLIPGHDRSCTHMCRSRTFIHYSHVVVARASNEPGAAIT